MPSDDTYSYGAKITRNYDARVEQTNANLRRIHALDDYRAILVARMRRLEKYQRGTSQGGYADEMTGPGREMVRLCLWATRGEIAGVVAEIEGVGNGVGYTDAF